MIPRIINLYAEQPVHIKLTVLQLLGDKKGNETPTRCGLTSHIPYLEPTYQADLGKMSVMSRDIRLL